LNTPAFSSSGLAAALQPETSYRDPFSAFSAAEQTRNAFASLNTPAFSSAGLAAALQPETSYRDPFSAFSAAEQTRNAFASLNTPAFSSAGLAAALQPETSYRDPFSAFSAAEQARNAFASLNTPAFSSAGLAGAFQPETSYRDPFSAFSAAEQARNAFASLNTPAFSSAGLAGAFQPETSYGGPFSAFSAAEQARNAFASLNTPAFSSSGLAGVIDPTSRFAPVHFGPPSAARAHPSKPQSPENNFPRYSVLNALLEELNPVLPQVWRGAVLASISDNPDRVRHVATSLREIMTHVLHISAPDDAVVRWSSSPEDFRGKKPTRRARLRFIFAASAVATTAPELIATYAEHLDLLSKRTHKLSAELTQGELEQVISKTGEHLSAVLAIRKTNGSIR